MMYSVKIDNVLPGAASDIVAILMARQKDSVFRWSISHAHGGLLSVEISSLSQRAVVYAKNVIYPHYLCDTSDPRLAHAQ